MELRAPPLSPTDPSIVTDWSSTGAKTFNQKGSLSPQRCWEDRIHMLTIHSASCIAKKNQVKMDHRWFTNYITHYLLWCQEHNWQKKNEYVGLLSKIKNLSVILIRAHRAWVLGPSVMLILENLIYQTFYVCSFWHKHIPLVMRKKDVDGMKFRGNLSRNVTSRNASWLPSPWPQNSWRGCIFS